MDNIINSMATNNKSDKNGHNGELTLREAASKLDISESTLKKYMKDFELDFDKGAGGRLLISEKTFQALLEITKLRTNGLSIQEIKELKTQVPSKTILEEIDESQEEKKVEEKNEIKLDTQTLVEVSQDVKEEASLSDEVSEEVSESELQSDEKQSIDEKTEVVRRRGFNYRYVERQISNDSKRVGSLRQRLRNTNLSVQERLFIEEALERRILFLDGWKHILRWVSSK